MFTYPSGGYGGGYGGGGAPQQPRPQQPQQPQTFSQMQQQGYARPPMPRPQQPQQPGPQIAPTYQPQQPNFQMPRPQQPPPGGMQLPQQPQPQQPQPQQPQQPSYQPQPTYGQGSWTGQQNMGQDIYNRLAGYQPYTQPGSQTGQFVQNWLQNPNPYNSQVAQQVFQGLSGQINQGFDQQRNFVNEDAARRGLTFSSVPTGELGDIGIR